MLDPIMNQLTDGDFSKTHNSIEFQHNIYFTYSELLRTVKEVITNFIFSRPKTDFEQLPNAIEAELAAYFWIWKEDYSNAKFARTKFEGFIECFINYKNNIPKMDDLVFQYLNHLPEMKPEDRSAAFSMCYIYYSRISNIEAAAKNKMKLIIDKNINLLEECNIYNIVVALFMVEMPKNFEWRSIECLQVIEKE